MSLSNSGEPFDKIGVSASKHSGGLCVCLYMCVCVCLLLQVAGLSEEVLLLFFWKPLFWGNYQHAGLNTCLCTNVVHCRKQQCKAKTMKAAKWYYIVEDDDMYVSANEGRLKQRRNSETVKLSKFYI